MSQKRICRLCLGYLSVGFSLVEDTYSMMLESLTAIKIADEEKEEFADLACSKCLSNLKFAFTIQQNMIKSNERFKETICNIEVKQEMNDDADEPDAQEVIILKPEPNDNDNIAFDDVKLCSSKCVICRKIVKDDISKHLSDHFNNEQTCDVCGIVCKDITDYQKHFVVNHDITNNYRCEYCEINFKYGPFYKLHLESHEKAQSLGNEDNITKKDKVRMMKLGIRSKKAVTLLLDTKDSKPDNEEGAPFVCGTCGKNFLRRRQFLSHTHQRSKCPICDAEITKTNIRKHILNHSSGPQVCELCGATLRSLESLRGHMAHTHSNVDYTCDECGRNFKKRYPYLLHKKKHAGEKTHICENCGKAFLTFYNLNKHIKMAHLKLRPHICEYCKKAFSSRFALRTHVRQHTNETPYKCEICGEGFRQNVSLRAHRKSKHNIIEPKTCACQVCGKEFGSEQAIISHMRLH